MGNSDAEKNKIKFSVAFCKVFTNKNPFVYAFLWLLFLLYFHYFVVFFFVVWMFFSLQRILSLLLLSKVLKLSHFPSFIFFLCHLPFASSFFFLSSKVIKGEWTQIFLIYIGKWRLWRMRRHCRIHRYQSKEKTQVIKIRRQAYNAIHGQHPAYMHACVIIISYYKVSTTIIIKLTFILWLLSLFFYGWLKISKAVCSRVSGSTAINITYFELFLYFFASSAAAAAVVTFRYKNKTKLLRKIFHQNFIFFVSASRHRMCVSVNSDRLTTHITWTMNTWPLLDNLVRCAVKNGIVPEIRVYECSR